MNRILPASEGSTHWVSRATGLEACSSFYVARTAPRHYHDTYQISWTRMGLGQLAAKGQRSACGPGSLVILAPGEVHEMLPCGRGCWHFDTLYIPSHYLLAVLEDMAGRPTELFAAPVPRRCSGRLIRLLQRTHAGISADDNRLTLESHFLDLMTGLASLSRGATQRPPPAIGPLRRAREYLEAHVDKNISLQQLADLAKLSPFHLTRAFRKQYGLPPHAFLLQAKVNRARTLLREGATVAQAALRVGFADQAHLNRHFKRLVGVTPAKYRSLSKNVQDALANTL